MKIFEILFETRSLTYLDHLKEDEIFDIIKKDCSRILEIYKKTKSFLYRGEKKNNTFFKSTYPKERLPKDMPINLHNLLNNALKKSGFVATRDNSVFVTSSIDTAKFYGNVYVFFPKNGFYYTWSKNITDAYTDYELIPSIINKKNIGIYMYNFNPNSGIKFYKLKNNKNEKEILKILNKILGESKNKVPKFNSLGGFFNYFDIHFPFIKIEEKEKIFKILLENFDITEDLSENTMEQIYHIIGQIYKKDNINVAIKNKKEIMFTDSYYYMLNYKHYENLLEKWINA